jgi:ABC-type dipeptide/oligopeptide/nickel transport system permease component
MGQQILIFQKQCPNFPQTTFLAVKQFRQQLHGLLLPIIIGGLVRYKYILRGNQNNVKKTVKKKFLSFS